MVFNATSNDISVISWQSVLLREETGMPGENTDVVTVSRILIFHFGSVPSTIFFSKRTWQPSLKVKWSLTD
jgi:hypothetical protein